jgi:hypothetical protein
MNILCEQMSKTVKENKHMNLSSKIKNEINEVLTTDQKLILSV